MKQVWGLVIELLFHEGFRHEAQIGKAFGCKRRYPSNGGVQSLVGGAKFNCLCAKRNPF